VNIRRHSGARTVVLRLGVDGQTTVLTVDDDGKGFEFSGRYTLDDLDRERRGPLVIKERVRQIGGTMILDSAPGRGSRLEITIPRSAA
jgi:signal transduction histidine kinase